MDKKIRYFEKDVRREQRDLKELERMDIKRDKACEYGAKMMKAKKKKK